MKLTLLAAAAVIAMPALAQTSPATTTPDTTNAQPSAGSSTADPMQTAPAQTAPGSATSTGDMATQPPQDSSMSTTSTTTAAPTTTTTAMPMASASGEDPVGGYQPAAPAMSGPMQPGATVTFQPAPSPDQAYPAPAPLASYPVCKKGEFDNCRNGPRSTHSREVRGRSSR